MHGMRLNKQQHDRDVAMEQMAAAGAGQLRSAAVRAMRAAMVRLAKGEVAMRIEVWRGRAKVALLERADAVKAGLEAEMVAGRRSGGLQQMAAKSPTL